MSPSDPASSISDSVEVSDKVWVFDLSDFFAGLWLAEEESDSEERLLFLFILLPLPAGTKGKASSTAAARHCGPSHTSVGRVFFPVQAAQPTR